MNQNNLYLLKFRLNRIKNQTDKVSFGKMRMYKMEFITYKPSILARRRYEKNN